MFSLHCSHYKKQINRNINIQIRNSIDQIFMSHEINSKKVNEINNRMYDAIQTNMIIEEDVNCRATKRNISLLLVAFL